MKVKVTVELDLPEITNENVDVKSECHPGITWEQAFLQQNIFDDFINYSIVSHLKDAMTWLVKSKGDEKSNEYLIHVHHNTWADILDKASKTMVVEIKQ